MRSDRTKSSPGVRRTFCRRCGAKLQFISESRPESFAPAIDSVDDDPRARGGSDVCADASESRVEHILPTLFFAFLHSVKRRGDMNRTIKTLFALSVLALACSVAAQDFEALKASVVKITSEFDGKRRTGTGFIVEVAPDAVYIVTAAHVIEGDQTPQIEFFVQRNRPLPAKVVKSEGGDPKGLALLVSRGKPPLGLLRVALAPEARSGDAVATIGFGQGQGDWGVILAHIASLDGRDLKLDGRIKEGNSGGPVFKGGAVIGIITSIDRDFALATPGQFVRTILANWGVSLAVAEPEAQPSARAAAENATKSQVDAVNAIAKALDEQVTKPIAAQTDTTRPARPPAADCAIPPEREGWSGKQAAAALGLAIEMDRWQAIAALARNGKLRTPLCAEEAAMILAGTTGASRTNAVGEIARIVKSELSGPEVAMILGSKRESSERDRLEAIAALARAKRFSRNLSAEELDLILQGTTGSNRALAVAEIAAN